MDSLNFMTNTPCYKNTVKALSSPGVGAYLFFVVLEGLNREEGLLERRLIKISLYKIKIKFY